MFTAFPNVTITTRGNTSDIEMRLEHNVGRESDFRLVKIERGSNGYRPVGVPIVIPVRLMEEGLLKGHNKTARAGNATLAPEGSEQITFRAGQKEYRGSKYVKLTVGSGGSRIEMVMTRRYFTETAVTINNLCEHPERYR